MIRILGIDHIVLRVVDVERMLRFYCEALGCTLERQDEKLGLIQLRAGDALIDLVPLSGELGRAGGAPPGREGRNLDHFCLRLGEFDEAALRTHLGSFGIETGEAAMRRGAGGDGLSIYISDPEGNTVELRA